MAEQADYALTHESPNDTELALLCAFIDQRVSSDLLCHKTRIFELIRSNGLIARSIMEQRFISRILSMYAQTKASSGTAGIDGQLVSSSIEIRGGKLNGKPYVAVVTIVSKNVVLRGPTRDTKNEAMESFIDKVLQTSVQWKETIELQRAQHKAAMARR